jgi:SAM-dependent methyltransferase
VNSPTSTIDTAAAEAYEEFLVPPVFGPWAEFVVGLADPRPGERILDIACGTGAATRPAAQRAGSAVGLDRDAAMIEVARRQHKTASCVIEWRCGNACDLNFANATFDLCLCLQGLQHFSARERALEEMRRVLKSSGRLVAAVWAQIEHTPGLDAVRLALEDEQIDPGAFRRPFALGNPGALESLVNGAGFSDVQVRPHERPAWFASVEAFLLALAVGSAASREALQQVSRERWSAFSAGVQQRLARFVGPAGLVFPYRAHVVLAKA